MISITAITSVITLVPRIIDAVQKAEQFIRGKGRGKEKKEAATENVIQDLKEAVEAAQEMSVPDVKSIKWYKLALSGPELAARVGDVIDAVVALMNFLSKFDEVPDVKDDPKLVN